MVSPPSAQKQGGGPGGEGEEHGPGEEFAGACLPVQCCHHCMAEHHLMGQQCIEGALGGVLRGVSTVQTQEHTGYETDI